MEIINSSASHHAMLFVFLVDEILKAEPEKGKELIFEAVKQYGFERGARMAKRAKLDGIEISAFSYDLYGEWECFPGQVECEFDTTGDCYQMLYSRCPWLTEWKTFGYVDYGKYYCDHVDMAIFQGFGLKCGSLLCSRIDGADKCRILFENKKINGEEEERLRALKYILGNQAKMPWEYHIGHLYKTFSEKITERLPEKAELILSSVMKKYNEHFGKAAGDQIVKFSNLDFTVLPPYPAPLKTNDSYRIIDRLIETDVLVVGNSPAAKVAAIEASGRGRSVVIMESPVDGRGGEAVSERDEGENASEVLLSGISDKNEAENDSARQRRIIKQQAADGFNIVDEKYLEKYYENRSEAVRILFELCNSDSRYTRYFASNDEISCRYDFYGAIENKFNNIKQLKKFENCFITDILSFDDKVSGALAIDYKSGSIVLIKAKSIILAGDSYLPFSNLCPKGVITGDELAAAYRAGVELTHMEFFDAYPLALYPSGDKVLFYPLLFESYYPEIKIKIVNDGGEETAGDDFYNSKGGRYRKLEYFRLFAKADHCGGGMKKPKLFIDFSDNTRKVKSSIISSISRQIKNNNPLFCNSVQDLRFLKKQISNNQKIELRLQYKPSFGGVKVDTDMESSMSGLFAAGASASEIYGAYKAGDGNIENLIQGVMAGISASKFCNRRNFNQIDRKNFEQTAISPLLNLKQIQMNEIEDISKHIQLLCGKYFGAVKNNEGLNCALEKIKDIREEIQKLPNALSCERKKNASWIAVMKTLNLITCCELGMEYALDREESRGMHIRSDCPGIKEEVKKDFGGVYEKN